MVNGRTIFGYPVKLRNAVTGGVCLCGGGGVAKVAQGGGPRHVGCSTGSTSGRVSDQHNINHRFSVSYLYLMYKAGVCAVQ
jgi:hypothetical protein